MDLRNVDGIISETKKNALIGFLKACLVAIAALCGVCGYLYRNASHCEQTCSMRIQTIQEASNAKLEDQNKTLQNLIFEMNKVKQKIK